MNFKLKKNLILVFITVTVDMLSIGFVLSLLPFYAGDSSIIMYSLLCIAYATAQLICMVPIGWCSDKFGRKKMLLISLFGSACGSILQFLAPKLGYLIVFRFFAGLFGTAIVSCQAYVCDCVNENEKSKYLSRIIGFALIATSIGPLIGSQLYLIKTWMPFLVPAILYIIHFFIILIFLDDSPKFDSTNYRSSLDALLPQIKSSDIISSEDATGIRIPRIGSGRIYTSSFSTEHKTNPEEAKAEKYRIISLYLIIIVALCDLIGMICMGVYSGKRLKDDYTDSVTICSLISSINLTVLTISQLFIFPFLSKRLYIPHMMLIGYFIQLIGWVLVNFLPFKIMYCGMIFHILGYGMTASGPSIIASRLVSADNQGKVLGSINTCMSLAQIIAPVAFGGFYTMEHRLPFVVGGCFIVLCIIIINVFFCVTKDNKILNQMKRDCYENNIEENIINK